MHEVEEAHSVDRVVKRKKSKPRFISVKPEELETFMRDVNEYKQILRSIGMYELCQNWKQNRNMQRDEEKLARRKLKLMKLEAKNQLGTIGYNIKKQQDELYGYLGIQEANNEEEEIEQIDNSKEHYVEYNLAYQNLRASESKFGLSAQFDKKKNDLNTLLQKGEEMDKQEQQERAPLSGDEQKPLQQMRSFDDGSREEVEISKDIPDKKFDSALDKKKASSSGLSKKTKANMVNKQLKKSQFRSQENSDVEGGYGENHHDLTNLSTHLFDALNASRLSDVNNKSLQRFTRHNPSNSDKDDDDIESLIQETDNEQQQQNHQDQNTFSPQDLMDEIEILVDNSAASENIRKEKKRKDKKKKKQKERQSVPQYIDEDDQIPAQVVALNEKPRKKRKNSSNRI